MIFLTLIQIAKETFLEKSRIHQNHKEKVFVFSVFQKKVLNEHS